MTLLTLILLLLLPAALAVGRGGAVESVRSLGRRGIVIPLVAGTLVLLGVLLHRHLFYMSPERETWITRGRDAGDTVSLGFNTKSRFRSLAQPLGKVTDRNGTLLAGYERQDGHLRRIYPAGPATAHLVGYWTGPVRDGVGVEKALTLVNDSLKDDLPHDVALSLDLRLQRDALRALRGWTGAVVVVDASNGQVLAAANLPTFHPDSVWDSDAWRRYALDTRNRPLTSRAIKDNFSPGSSIKPLVAAAADYYNSVLPEELRFSCTGEYNPGEGIPPITDHGSRHGRVDLARAMRVSCNTYFSMLAYEQVGFGPMAAYLDSLGFNQRLLWNTGIMLNEYGALRPALSWVRARDEIARSRIGIGQASVKVNPLHMAVLMAGIANDGVFLRPTLELERPADTLHWKLDSAAAVRLQALMREPLLPGGTATGVFSGLAKRGVTVHGKTGTADREPDGREPSWFVSFAEKNGRKYAVAVAIQNRRGNYAGALNAPIARTMYESLERYNYFGK